MDFRPYLLSKIEKAQDKDIFTNLQKQFTLLKQKVVCDSIEGAKKNQEYYLKFLEIIKHQDYFKMWQVDELGLEYDIFIFLAKKGVGKSYHMIEMCNDIVDDGESSVAILRATLEDVKSGLAGQLTSYDAHFIMDAQQRLWHKHQTVPDERNPSRMVPRQCGIAMGLKTAYKHKGGGFEGYKMIIGDELTDNRDGIGVKEYENFFVSLANSIEREKKNIKFVAFGNTDSNVTSHPLFECFQIDPDENLVYVTRQFEGADRPTRILYINSRGMYRKGANESIFIGSVGNVHRAMKAFLNEGILMSYKTVALDVTVLAEPEIAIIWNDTDNETKLVKIAKYEYYKDEFKEETDFWYFIVVEDYDPMYLYGYTCFTDDMVLGSLHDHTTIYAEEIVDQWDFIKYVIVSGRCFFIGAETHHILAKLIPSLPDSDAKLW